MSVTVYEVGGCVRDDLLGVPTKDVDFVVEAGSFAEMREHLVAEGFKLFLEKPEFLTVRCGVPKGHPLREVTRDADFVLARKDGAYSDGRHPDEVVPGTLADDLARRDFTVNAMARDPYTGAVFDHHGGRQDLEQRVLRFVGDPMTRVREDGLRVLRGFRFMLTKEFGLAAETEEALFSREAAEMLKSVSVERVREELEKMLKFDSERTVALLGGADHLRKAVFRNGLRFSATLKA